MERYAKYLRKSRFDRDYAALSVEETLKRHEAILDQLARERGYPIARTYYEVVSGESIASRPEIQKLLAEVNEGRYAGVLVVDLERLARGNSADQAYISQVFQCSGTRIITPAKVYDPRDEMDEEYFEFGLFMSRREYKTINRRLIRGRDSSAAEGKYLGSIAPYGYRRVKLPGEKGYTLEPLPQEAEVVRMVFAMFLQNAGTKVIANALNDQRIPTRHGGLWTYSTIANMLTNPVYTGKIRRGWSQQVRRVVDGVVTKRILRHKDPGAYKTYDGLHPALISAADFALAQQLRLGRQPAAKVRRDFALQNAFAGLIFCARCGQRIGRTTLSATQHSRVRLRCVNARNCHNVSADYALVEQEILRALQAWLEGYRVQLDADGLAGDIARCQAQLARLGQEADRLGQQLDNACALLEQGVYTPELFQARREKLTEALQQAQRRQAEAAETLRALESGQSAQADLIPQTEALLASYDVMTNQERNALLRVILQRIEYAKGADGRIEIDLYPRLPKL